MNFLKITAAIIILSINAKADVSKTQCLPIKNFNGKVTIQALCDATEFNKKYDLKIGSNGCATEGQGIQSESAFVLHQAPVVVTTETEADLQTKLLPTCTIQEAGLILTIEPQPWQQ